MAQVVLKPKQKEQAKGVDKPFRGFSLDSATDAQIDALAGKYGMSRSELIRTIVGQVYDGEFSKGGAV